jgi:hypothetical protein
MSYHHQLIHQETMYNVAALRDTLIHQIFLNTPCHHIMVPVIPPTHGPQDLLVTSTTYHKMNVKVHQIRIMVLLPTITHQHHQRIIHTLTHKKFHPRPPQVHRLLLQPCCHQQQ